MNEKQTFEKPGCIMILGPSEYLVPGDVHVVEVVPKQVRLDLVKYLKDHAEDRATAMEEWGRRPGESNTAMFERILLDAPVRAFLVYWPLGAKLLGLDWELGILTQKFRYADFPPERVFLLIERDVLIDDPESGTTVVDALDEKGNRTQYH